MSQRIVTECDECAAAGETREAVTVVVRALGHDFEVDLCDEHAKSLAVVVERLADLGRGIGMVEARATCPRCGRAFASPQALGKHAKSEHGESVNALRRAKPAPVEVEPAAHACPECGRTFRKAQALAVHRRRSHGIGGTSKASASRRRGAAHEGEAPGGE